MNVHPYNILSKPIILNLLALLLLCLSSRSQQPLLDSINQLNIHAFKLQYIDVDSGLKLNLSLYKSLPNPTDILTLSNLQSVSGTLYQQKGDYDIAVDYFQKSLDNRKKLSSPRLLGNIRINLGNLYYALHQYDKAIVNLRLSTIDLSISQSSDPQLKNAFNSLGAIFAYLNKLDSAEKYFMKALAIVDSSDQCSDQDRIDVLCNLADFYMKRYEWDIAEQTIKNVLLIQDTLNDQNGKAWVMHKLGIVQMENNDYDKSQFTLINALKIAQRLTLLEEEKDISSSLTSLYILTNQTNKALEQKSHYKMVSDLLYKRKLKKNIQETEAKYQLEKHEAARILSEEKAARSNAEAKAGRQLNYVLFGLLFIVSLSGAFGYRFYQQKRYISQIKLEVKEKQLAEIQAKSEAESIKAMLNGQEHERNRIARDLHDRVGNLLATLKLSLRREDVNLNPQVELIDETVKEVREIAENLSSDQVNNHGLIQALAELKQNVEKSAGIQFQLYLNEETDKLDKSLALEVYRIVQELVSNTLKHAKASIISIQTNGTNGTNQEFNLIYEDNGIGFVADKVQEGMGSRNIRSRVEFVNGKYHIDSQPGRGTIVILDIDA
ncbi:MAG: hypothetical protein CL840_18920 [Crocinitomicaceae bacterium]|nr:hypothetical protein [Crocinitomicaceae bacterium]|tara:strand:- start:5199 stop:7019 length:1821 start_codon:yes stop_codon:yes gene_type:complete